MTLQARLILALGALAIACGDSGAGETSTTTSSTTGDPPGTTTSGSTGTPTTTSAESSSSTGEPAHTCIIHEDEATCAADPLCLWKGVVQFVHSAQGCQGNIDNFCVDKMPSGGASAWYREVGGDPQVVEFSYTPDDLGPEWKPCTCDGPLACLCTSVTEDCPERLDEFCGAIATSMGCDLANIKGNSRCAWLSVSSEGPPDANCGDGAQIDLCIPADNASADTCMPPAYTFGGCAGFGQDIFWRDNNGEIEVTIACGPAPLGFTKCEGDDTPEQPDECKCRCL